MEKKSAKARVVVVPCPTYREEIVYQAVKCGIDLLGGMEKFVKPEEKILVKPNFLSAAAPESAVTTHPSVMKAVFRILQETGCGNIKYGDSPGHGSCQGAASKLGLDENDVFGAKLADMSQEVLVSYPEGMTAKEFYFAKEVTEADAIINLCKMKTHALERVTGAVKNLYGLICGYRKAAGHVKYPNASIFARMLADIHRCVKPRLHIMDGIVAMEGNGPGSGDPIPMNVLLFSEDPVALDTVFCHLVYLNPEMVPTNTQGMAMGIGTCLAEEIEIVVPEDGKIVQESNAQAMADEMNSNAETNSCVMPSVKAGNHKQRKGKIVSAEELQRMLGAPEFDVDRKGTKKTFLSRYSDFMTRFSRRPVINKKKCIKCGICVNHCPVPGKAVQFKKGKAEPPVYDYTKCIRCYCCQEMCPQSAIHARGKR